MTEPISIDLWTFPLDVDDAGHDRLARHLTDAELARAARFIAVPHQRWYRAGRGRMREILASYLGIEPDTIEFVVGPFDKPSLAGGGLHFNLSHTGALATLGVCRTHEIGVDIEAERPITEDLAERYFAPEEIAALRTSPAADFTAGFFRCWTRKEAVVKAVGDGLTIPLSSFVVDVTNEPSMPLIKGPRGSDGAQWRILSFRPRPDVAGAVAIRAAGALVTLSARA